MREIKFRVWDSITKKMFIPDGILKDGRSFILNFAYGNEFPIMQFTGLLDKNGKEIYENDIVKSESHTNPSSFQIEFIEGGFCATNPIIKGYPLDINHFYPSVGCCIEVIGNIYESPELLREK